MIANFRHGEPYSRVGILHRYTTLQLQFQKQFTLHCHPTVVSELQGTLHFHPTVVLVVVQVSLLNCRVPYNNILESRLQGTQQPTFVKQVVGCLRNYTTSIVVLCCVGSMQGSPSLLLMQMSFYRNSVLFKKRYMQQSRYLVQIVKVKKVHIIKDLKTTHNWH